MTQTAVHRKRKAITFKMKLDIIQRHEKGEAPSHIGSVFGHSRSTVGTIIKDKQRILEHVTASAPLQSTLHTKKRSDLIEKMESMLVRWLEDQGSRHIPVSLIRDKALSFYEQLKSSENASDVLPF